MPDLDQHPSRLFFKTTHGLQVPSVTAQEMRAVDRIAEEVFSLSVLQMMENAGRNLAQLAIDMHPGQGRFLIMAGTGGNGGGGLSCARHLHNHGRPVDILLSRSAEDLTGPAAVQYKILTSAGLTVCPKDEWQATVSNAGLIIDALLGYSLMGPPRGFLRELIFASNAASIPILSLDLPSGLDATTGDVPGEVMNADRTLTLALPKRGLQGLSGQLFLGDIGIPSELYSHIELEISPIFSGDYWLELRPPGQEVI